MSTETLGGLGHQLNNFFQFLKLHFGSQEGLRSGPLAPERNSFNFASIISGRDCPGGGGRGCQRAGRALDQDQQVPTEERLPHTAGSVVGHPPPAPTGPQGWDGTTSVRLPRAPGPCKQPCASGSGWPPERAQAVPHPHLASASQRPRAAVRRTREPSLQSKHASWEQLTPPCAHGWAESLECGQQQCPASRVGAGRAGWRSWSTRSPLPSHPPASLSRSRPR